MLSIIKNVPVISRKIPFEIELDKKLLKKIQSNWDLFVKDNIGYWDGDLLAVTKFDLEKNRIELGKAKYSWLIYSKNHSDLDIRSLFVSILFKTLDNYYVIIKNIHGKINIIGGIVENSDLEDQFCPDICLCRELKEELNLNLYNKKYILDYQMKYLKTPNPGRNYGIVYIGVLKFTKEELLNYFSLIKNQLDQEVSELLLLSKEEVLALNLKDDDISYLKELMKFE